MFYLPLESIAQWELLNCEHFCELNKLTTHTLADRIPLPNTL